MSIRVRGAWLQRSARLICLTSILGLPAASQAALVKAEFQVYGSHFHLVLGQDATLRADVSVDGSTLATGLMRYNVGWGTPTGVFAGQPLIPDNSWGIIDASFAVTFEMLPNQPVNLEMGLVAGGSRAVWGFSRQTFMPGDPGTGASIRGLRMTGITLSDGRPLADEGLAFELIPDAVELAAGYTIEAVGTSDETLFADSDSLVLIDPVQGFVSAAASVVGGLPWLEANPDPNPFIIDSARGYFRSASGGGTAQLVSTGIPEPSAFLLLTIGMLSLGLGRARRQIGTRAD